MSAALIVVQVSAAGTVAIDGRHGTSSSARRDRDAVKGDTRPVPGAFARFGNFSPILRLVFATAC